LTILGGAYKMKEASNEMIKILILIESVTTLKIPEYQAKALSMKTT